MDETVAVNRALLKLGMGPGPDGVQELEDRRKAAETSRRALEGRLKALQRDPGVQELDRLRALERAVLKLLAEEGVDCTPDQALPLRLTRWHQDRSRTRDHVLEERSWALDEAVQEARGLRAEMARRALETGEPSCRCGYATPLYDLLGHDALGHRTGLVLFRSKLFTEELIRERSDEDLAALWGMGKLSLRRIHTRMQHCGLPEGSGRS